MSRRATPRPSTRGRWGLLRLYARRSAHAAADRLGFDVVPLASIRNPAGRRAALLRTLAIDLVLDVGANTGQFACEIRKAGYGGAVLSVEPNAEAFDQLQKRAARDGAWTIVQCGLGPVEGASVLHIAGNSASSSVLPMAALHEAAAPGTAYVRDEQVVMRRLDALLTETPPGGSRVYLKIDVQGFELEVLRGVGDRIGDVVAMQLEVSLASLYAGAPLADDVHAFVSAAGYGLAGIEPGFTDPRSGRMLQYDGIYVRDDVLGRLDGATS